MTTVAKIMELTAESSSSFEDAIKAGLTRAKKTVDNITGAYVKEQQVVCNNGNIEAYRVNLKVTFVIND